jgi:hypothetical protein
VEVPEAEGWTAVKQDGAYVLVPGEYPSDYIKVVRSYQARCPCGESSEFFDYPERYKAEDWKRNHARTHRKDRANSK